MEKAMWAIAICQIEPFAEKASEKKRSRLIPITTSGVTIGRRISVSAAPAAAPERRRARPRPRSVPRTVVAATATTATWREKPSAGRRGSLQNNYEDDWKEK